MRALVFLFLALLGTTLPAAAQAPGEPIRLTRITHIYGIFPHPQDAERVIIATDRGVYAAGADGNAQQISTDIEARQAFSVTREGNFLATGAAGEGAVISRNFGQTWVRLGQGAQPGPFLVIEPSLVDARLVYAATASTLYRSDDGGLTWIELGAAPAPVVDMAAANTRDVVYLATARGLYRSADGGRTWALLSAEGSNRATSAIATMPDGFTYAFVTGVGLVAINANGVGWAVGAPATNFDGALLHFTARQTGRAYAVTQYMKILVSDDRGRTWAPFNR